MNQNTVTRRGFLVAILAMFGVKVESRNKPDVCWNEDEWEPRPGDIIVMSTREGDRIKSTFYDSNMNLLPWGVHYDKAP